ncbi:T9SS type A sorting domain-containing protein [Dyadobacter subterraneus]|uniref:T9SS type A sorting domain-containing protein n=1 Tax=Dyadobacter subterraneus TaxID=2773304 RepID=A0ABR9WEB5_9BACT|nr:T9SS type A sorting domain-containing protein [Dyadobacter subterraneus]MBE9463772.1 T9SS type A sorting domain-containing protein [Dyadobacter subterraneus]
MKKHLYFLLSILISHHALSVNRTWVGTTDNFSTASNWSPSGVPTDQDILTIANAVNSPVIYVGTDANAKRIFMRTGAVLTVNSGASLTVTNANPSNLYLAGLDMTECSLINHGTITIKDPPLAGYTVGIGAGGSSITNSGIINTYGDDAIQLSSICEINNLPTGTINVNAQVLGVYEYSSPGAVSNISNSGTINIASKEAGIYLSQGLLSNSGSINLSESLGISLQENATLNNLSCGRVILQDFPGNDLMNLGTVNNNGLIQIYWSIENSGTISNHGVLKYQNLISAGGTLTSTDIIIQDKTNPIVQVGSAATSVIVGIYRNEAGTISAGTFTPPNQFSPSGLPAGNTTLYAKITSSGNSCEYIVPFVYTAPPLPVTLTNFSGKNTGNNQNKLTWLTSDEKNFAYFEIQRSNDARSFESIGSVQASQQSSALKSYEFTDSYTLGMNYYRLKMVDRDGSYNFSKIISISTAVDKDFVGSFYPNPSSGPVFVDVYAEASEAWQIRVFSTSGKMIASQSIMLQKGINKVPLTNLIKGTNIVQFQNSKTSTSKALVYQ